MGNYSAADELKDTTKKCYYSTHEIVEKLSALLEDAENGTENGPKTTKYIIKSALLDAHNACDQIEIIDKKYIKEPQKELCRIYKELRGLTREIGGISDNYECNDACAEQQKKLETINGNIEKIMQSIKDIAPLYENDMN